MAREINQVEMNHIIDQFHQHNMTSDMAMLFITQDMSFDKLFERFLTTPIKFYKDVFSYIYKYITDKIDKGQLDIVFRDVISKLDCYVYDTKIQINGCVNKYGFSSVIIQKTLLYLLSDNDLNGINSFIDMMSINPNIDNRVIFDVLSQNKDLCHQYVISNIISGEYLSIEDIFRLILIRSEDLPLDDVRMLIREIFFNKNMMLTFAAHVFSFYVITVDYKDNKCNVNLTCKLRGSEKELIDNIRQIIIEVIWIDAELDYYDFLDDAKGRHRDCKNMYMAGLYNTYISWFRSQEREDNSIANFLFNGYEEDLSLMQLNQENMKELSIDMMNLLYITDISMYEGYELFIKMFNLNRFLLGHYNNTFTAERHLSTIIEDEGFAIRLAIDTNFYIFLCLR